MAERGTVANSKVTLLRRVRVDGGWRYYPAAYAPNGRVKPGVAVVAATMPSLLLLSRAHAYTPVRIICAIFALAASIGWIVERTLNTPSTIDPILETIAHHASWIAATLFLVSLINLLWQRISTAPAVTDSQRQTAF